MNLSDDLSSCRVAIAGLGLMGGSLAMALRGKCAGILGYDPDAEVRALAVERRVIDFVSAEPAEIFPQAGLIVLAAPVCAVVELLRNLPQWHSGPAVVLDLGSTKVDILREMALLPPGLDPVGGHPICGKEQAGMLHAESGLFIGAPFVLAALPQTTVRARRLAETVALAIGSRPLWLEAEKHDRWVAVTSHLPYAVAALLAGETPGEAAPLIGPGWRGVARLAASSPEMMLDIFHTNRDNILSVLRRYRFDMEELEALLEAADDEGLRRWMVERAARHAELVPVKV